MARPPWVSQIARQGRKVQPAYHWLIFSERSKEQAWQRERTRLHRIRLSPDNRGRYRKSVGDLGGRRAQPAWELLEGGPATVGGRYPPGPGGHAGGNRGGCRS